MDLLFDIKEGLSSEGLKTKYLVYLPKNELNDSNNKMLDALLGAIKLGRDLVDLRAFSDASRLTIDEQAQYVIIFGYNNDQHFSSLRLEKYNVYDLENTKVLASDSLSELGQDKGLKMKLWQCLQQMFLKVK